jgi:hypothetical protein
MTCVEAIEGVSTRSNLGIDRVRRIIRRQSV